MREEVVGRKGWWRRKERERWREKARRKDGERDFERARPAPPFCVVYRCCRVGDAAVEKQRR
jgi:hypothetical protein